MASDLSALTGTPNTNKSSNISRRTASETSAGRDKPTDFGRELGKSRADRQNDTAKPSTSAQTNNSSATTSRHTTTPNSLPKAIDERSSDAQPAGLVRQWRLPAADLSPDAKSSMTATTQASLTARVDTTTHSKTATVDRSAATTQNAKTNETPRTDAHTATDPAAASDKTQVTLESTDGSNPPLDTTSRAAETPAQERALRASAQDPDDDSTGDAALTQVAPVIQLAASDEAPRPAVSLANARATDSIDGAMRRGHAAKDTASSALAQSLARAEANAAAGQTSGQAGTDTNTRSHLLQTLTQEQTDALARAAERSGPSGFSPSQTHVQADATHSTPGHTGPVGIHSGPSATIAGGVAGQAASPNMSSGISAPMGSEQWNAALGQQTMRLASAGTSQHAQIQLHPRELGQISISVTVDDHNQAQLHFASAHGHVRDAVEAALPQLRQSLSAGGLSLGQTSVGDQNSQPAFGDGSAEGRSGNDHPGAGEALAAELGADHEPGTASTVSISNGLRGGVDIFA